jgi:uncharacterized membrane protein YoaK (UPF0700 family)
MSWEPEHWQVVLLSAVVAGQVAAYLAHRRDLVSDRFEVVWIALWLGALVGADWSPWLFSIAVTVLAAMSVYATILIIRGPRRQTDSGQDDGDERERARA